MRRIDSSDFDAARLVLVVLPTWVGDFVMATPALRAIRERFVDARITFLAEPNLLDLVRGGNWMDETVAWPVLQRRSILHRDYREVAGELRRRAFDLAILLPNSFRAALMARFARAKQRVGYDRDGRGWLLTDRVPVRNLRSKWSAQAGDADAALIPPNLPVKPGKYVPMRLVDYYADLAAAIGCERPGDRFELFTTDDCEESVTKRLADLGIVYRQSGPADAPPLVVISPGAKYGAAKCWSPERFAAVADRLIERRNATVIVTCGPGEQRIADQIGRAMRRNGYVFDNPILTLGQLKSLIKRCDLLLCNDAGPRHFAKAFGAAVVTVFGPTHPEWTATAYAREATVRIDVDCGPCQQRVCPLDHLQCMEGVSVDLVFDAVSRLLSGAAR